MNTIIHTEDIFPLIEQELSNVHSDLVVVSAFVKRSALKKLDNILVGKKIRKRLLVRFRKEDIIFGSTDLELYDYCVENEWELFFNLDLHSKIFVFDKSRYIIGSSNVTLSGLGISNKPNIETVCKGVVTSEEYDKIESFFSSSQELTKKIYDLMFNQIEEVDSGVSASSNILWCSKIRSLFIFAPKQLWVSEMIFSASPYDMNSHDRSLLDIKLKSSNDLDAIRKSFEESKCYKWLIGSFDDEIYFGELSAKLHNTIIDNPTPYRKDIKILLSNLINWIKELSIAEVQIDRPNYSQRIRKVT